MSPEGTHMWRRTIPIAACLVAALGSPATAAESIVATEANEGDPAASTTHVAWQVTTRRGHNVYAKPLGGARFRVNPDGAFGAMGGIDGTTLVYQEYVRDPRPVSDITFVDLETAASSDAPAGVNTDDWEHSPSLSGDKLVFGRELPDGVQLVVLYDLATGVNMSLASASPGNRFIHVGQVNGNYVTWSRDAWRGDDLLSCDVFVYDIAADETTRVPNANDRCQYAPSVDPSGTVYFARSGFGCARNVAIMRYPLDGTVQRVEPVTDGQDLTNTFAVDNGDGTTTVYMDPGRCTRDGAVPNQDIEAIVV
jgi:hypothetical protein